MRFIAPFFIASFLVFSNQSIAQSDKPLSAGEERLITSERVLGAHESVASIPMSYNFDRKVGLAHQGSTQYIKIQPYLPYRINTDYSFVVQPQLGYQSFNNFDGYSNSGYNPIIIQSFLTQANQRTRTTSYGIGPMVQIRTNMPWMFGSAQNGAGYSLGAIHRTEDWTMGITAYQSFGVGATPTTSMSANNISFRPFITYITKRYGNYTLDSESLINIDSGMHSYPINLTGIKLVNLGEVPLLFTVGVRYYTVNTMMGGAQGWGGRVGITYAFSN
jgi:hypothetical protein